jgi:protein-tyrosine-phosphatase
VCIGNRNRSPFAEFFFSKLLSERDNKLTDKINITSAGFLPQRMKDKMAALKIVAPNPFFGRSLPQTTRTSLLRHGIIVSEAWRSKELTRELAEQADLIITVLPDQKEDIKRIYPNIASRIITIREISQWEDYLLQEDYDFKKIPRDNTLWNYVEEDSEYVATILLEMEKMLIKAYPSIIAKLGFKINGAKSHIQGWARQQ